MDRKSLIRIGRGLILMLMLLSACRPVPGPTVVPPTERPPQPSAIPPRPTDTLPEPTATPSTNFTISTNTNKVFFGSSNPLGELANSQPAPFPEGYQVNTDQDGVAVLRGSADACTIYVFRTTSLMKTACQPGTYAGSNVSCVEEGSALYNQCSGHIVITPSGVAEHRETTLSVTYLPERQITLYLAVDGAVDIRPLRRLGDYTQLSDPVRLEEGQFFFTAPDDRVATIGGFSMRVAAPLEQIAPLVSELDLLSVFQDTQSGLDEQAIPVQVIPVEMIPPVFTARLVGAPIDKPLGREALLAGAPWVELAEAAIPFQGMTMTADTLELTDPVDIRNSKYNPALTKEILAGQGFREGVSLMIYYSDDLLSSFAAQLSSALAKNGFFSDPVFSPSEQIMALMRANQAQGQAAVWLQLEIATGDPASSEVR
jgi:hypothetical protein